MDEKALPQQPESSETQQVEQQYSQLRTLLSWSAPGRPFERKTKQYFLNMILIVLLIQVILFLFSQYALMVLVAALVFLAYALGTVSPHDFHFKVTTEGVMVEDHFYLWEELYDFYFKKQHNQDVLIIGTKAWVPGELTVVLGDIHKEQVRDILIPYLPYREFVKPTFMEKSSTWLERNFPLDKPLKPRTPQE